MPAIQHCMDHFNVGVGTGETLSLFFPDGEMYVTHPLLRRLVVTYTEKMSPIQNLVFAEPGGESGTSPSIWLDLLTLAIKSANINGVDKKLAEPRRGM